MKAEQALQFQTLMAAMQKIGQGKGNDVENRFDT